MVYLNGSLTETISSVTFSLTGGNGTMKWAETNNNGTTNGLC